MPAPLIEFPADDPDRARRFGAGFSVPSCRQGPLKPGQGPGDTASLPYFTVADLPATLERVRKLGGSVVHPGGRWAICRDSEGSAFALAAGLDPLAR